MIPTPRKSPVQLAYRTYAPAYYRAPIQTYRTEEFSDVPISCEMCRSDLLSYVAGAVDGDSRARQNYRICKRCGWWLYVYGWDDLVDGDGQIWTPYSSEIAHLPLHDPSVPEKALLEHLRSWPEHLRDIHHRKFEEVVASIYREILGYEVELRKQTHDKGIDLYAINSENGPIAVEVKQRRDPARPIGIAALQRLVGAAYARGLFEVHLVTNAHFSNAAEVEARKVQARQMRVSLVDFSDLADALGILPSQKEKPAVKPASCPLWRADSVLESIHRGGCCLFQA